MLLSLQRASKELQEAELFRDKMSSVQTWMTRLKLPADLRAKIRTYYAEVCCAVMCCAVLCCFALCCAVLFCGVLYSSVLCCAAMLCSASLCCIATCCAVHAMLQHPTLCCHMIQCVTKIYYSTLCNMCWLMTCCSPCKLFLSRQANPECLCWSYMCMRNGQEHAYVHDAGLGACCSCSIRH